MTVVVDQIVTRIDHSEIDLSPDFQRKCGIWDDERKSRLIESLLLRVPIPVFYVAADENENWSIVDGLQRTSTIYGFVKGNFKLSKMEYLDKLNGKEFGEIPRNMQRRIRETQLGINIIEPGTPEEVMFNIFRRINTGGLILNAQEIRHAIHPGSVRQFLNDLAISPEFLSATDNSIQALRMADQECVLRFLAFYIDPWEHYTAQDLDGYLGHAMKKINAMNDTKRNEIRLDFMKAMRASRRIFDRRAFRKMYNHSEPRRPISKALFETWSVGFARRTSEHITILVEQKDTLISEFIGLMNDDPEFEKSISYSTGNPKRVQTRFSRIDGLIERCL